MTQVTLNEVAEEARGLTPDEQRQLRDLLDTWLSQADLTTEEREEELERRLLAKGLLRSIPPPIEDLRPYRDRRLVEVEGEPLSQTIIRER